MRAFLRERRGIAMFMAALILLALSVLALSSMSRVSESSHLAGQDLTAKKMSILADAAIRVALAEFAEQFMTNAGIPAAMYINATNDQGGRNTFRIFEDKGDGVTPFPPFAFRAKATLVLSGDSSTIVPGMDAPFERRSHAFDVQVDVRDLIPMGNADISPNLGVFTASDGTKYYFGALKSQGVITGFRKR